MPAMISATPVPARAPASDSGSHILTHASPAGLAPSPQLYRGDSSPRVLLAGAQQRQRSPGAKLPCTGPPEVSSCQRPSQHPLPHSIKLRRKLSVRDW